MKKTFITALMMSISMFIIAQTPGTFLGVTSNQVHPSKANKLDFPQAFGSYITSIVPGSSAEKADFQAFDYIYQIGEYQLGAEQNLKSALNNYKPGDGVEIKFIRKGEQMSKQVKLGDTSQSKHTSKPSNEDPFLGIHQTHWSGGEERGIKVKIQENTTADLIGLQDEDIVIMVDDYPILDWHDVGAAIDNREVCDEIKVTVLRNGLEKSFSGIIQSEDGPGDCNDVGNQIQNLLNIQNMKDMEVEMEPVTVKEKTTFKNNTGLEMPEDSRLQVEELNLFPNPNIGQFEISFNLNGTGDVNIRIFNPQGKIMLSKDLQEFSGYYQESFNLGDSPAGVYYLMVRQGRDSMTRKIIVARN